MSPATQNDGVAQDTSHSTADPSIRRRAHGPLALAPEETITRPALSVATQRVGSEHPIPAIQWPGTTFVTVQADADREVKGREERRS